MAFHANMGQDITGLTEISVDTCGSCHGDLATIQTDTDGFLQDGSNVANPHLNHMSQQFECSDCHGLTGPSTIGCNSCHKWELTQDNGMFEGSAQ